MLWRKQAAKSAEKCHNGCSQISLLPLSLSLSSCNDQLFSSIRKINKSLLFLANLRTNCRYPIVSNDLTIPFDSLSLLLSLMIFSSEYGGVSITEPKKKKKRRKIVIHRLVIVTGIAYGDHSRWIIYPSIIVLYSLILFLDLICFFLAQDEWHQFNKIVCHSDNHHRIFDWRVTSRRKKKMRRKREKKMAIWIIYQS